MEENNFNINNEPQKSEENQAETQAEPINFFDYVPENYIQKREIRQKANIIGVAALCILVIVYFWNDLYLLFTIGVLRLSSVAAQKSMYDPAVQQINQIAFSIIIFLVPFTIALKSTGEKINNLVDFKKPKGKLFWPFVLIGVGFCAFSNIAVSMVSNFFRNVTGGEYNVPGYENPKGIYGFLLSFIATAIVPALVEEFACRGIILGMLKKYSEGFAIITSSVIFGVIHGNFEQIPFAFIVGLILGYVYVKTQSLWACILVHSANNAVSVIFNYEQMAVGVEIQAISYTAYLIIAMILAIIGIVSIAKNANDDFSLSKGNSVVKESQKYLCFFTSWSVLLFVAANIYEAMGYFKF